MNCRVSGFKNKVFISYLGLCGSIATAQTILLDPPPVAQPLLEEPAMEPKKKDPPQDPNADPGKNQNPIPGAESKAQEATPLPKSASNKAKLTEELKLTRPYRLLVFQSFILPKISVQGPLRKNYTVDPTLFLHILNRFGEGLKQGQADLFSGLRLAPFAGLANYKGRLGNYGSLYYGPLLGYGYYPVQGPTPTPEAGPENISNTKEAEPEAPRRWGYLFMAGLSLSTRWSKIDASRPNPGGDLGIKPFEYDSPGIWLESALLYNIQNIFNLSPIIGFQIGKKKLFYYGGLGLGMWY